MQKYHSSCHRQKTEDNSGQRDWSQGIDTTKADSKDCSVDIMFASEWPFSLAIDMPSQDESKGFLFAVTYCSLRLTCDCKSHEKDLPVPLSCSFTCVDDDRHIKVPDNNHLGVIFWARSSVVSTLATE